MKFWTKLSNTQNKQRDELSNDRVKEDFAFNHAHSTCTQTLCLRLTNEMLLKK